MLHISRSLRILAAFSGIAFLAIPYAASASCPIFSFGDCADSSRVNYCNSDDPNSASNCSIDKGVDIAKNGINDIVTQDQSGNPEKFSSFIQKVVAYLMTFLGIIGVLYIIYAGFIILTGSGDDEKIKKSKKIVTFVIAGFVLIFLAYPIVKLIIGDNGNGGILNEAFERVIGVEKAYAYTEYDMNTFDQYKKDIELMLSSLERDYKVNGKISASSISQLRTLVTAAMDTFPENNDSVLNTNLGKEVLTSLDLVSKAPDSDTYIMDLAKSLNNFATKSKVGRITAKLIASPEKGNAPLSVTFRAEEAKDPSGVTVPKENYIWWMRANSGQRTVLGSGPTVNYTFKEERTYTVFLSIVSASRNAKGKTDVLPFSQSVPINVLPRIANLYFYINGTNVTNTDVYKVTPTVAKQGLIFDASSSQPSGGTKFLKTLWNFGNGNQKENDGGPRVERQVYATEGTYKVRLEVLTNENQKITKDVTLEMHDPVASIKAEKTSGFVTDEYKFNAASNYTTAPVGYEWKVVDLSNDKVLKTDKTSAISMKFPKRGKYSVKLRTLLPSGRDDNDTVNISIESREPVATFDAQPVNSETPNTYTFNATRSYDPDTLDFGQLSFSWMIDGQKAELVRPDRNGSIGQFTFTTLGTHQVVLEVANKDGKVASFKQDVTINSLLSVKLNVDPLLVKINQTVQFEADAKEAKTFEWTYGDGERDVTTEGRASHSYKKSGTYDVNLSVRSENTRDSNSITRKVYVTNDNTPTSIITVKKEGEPIVATPNACNGKEAFVIDRAKPVTFSADLSVNTDGNNGGLSYMWKYGGGRTSSQQSVNYKFEELGCYPLTLTVRDAKTGSANTAEMFVRVDNLLPKYTNITATADRLESDPVVVKVNLNNAVDEDGAIVSYIWYYYTENDSEPQDFRITKTPNSVFVLPRVSGKYFFAATIEDSNGAKVNTDENSTDKASVTLSSDNMNTPIVDLSVSSTSVAVGKDINFQVQVKNVLGSDISDKAEYKWDFDGDGFFDQTTNTPKSMYAYKKPGNFNFKVKVTYKGISNTKYQSVLVKNDIEPSVNYVAIGKKFVFFNTTPGFYTKAKWLVPNGATGTNPDYFMYDFGEDELPESISVEVGAENAVKLTSVGIRRDVPNALKVRKSEKKLIFFSYPKFEDETIHLKNSSDRLFLYLGESKGNAVEYRIDTDVKTDSDLNGTPDDDIDNKGTDSYTTGAPFVIKEFPTNVKERTIRISLYDGSKSLIETQDIKVMLDYANESATELTNTGSGDTLKDIGEKDKVNMEKLKDLIRNNAAEKDRLKMMQYLSLLQENWFDQREKTKTIIDFEGYIDTSELAAKQKDEFYGILEWFLVGEDQTKDEVTLAAKVLKSLIPKTNAAYTEIMTKIDEILAHPTNIPENKELGRAILEAVKSDTTIENSDKITIKSQLEVIIYGGSTNVPAVNTQENINDSQSTPPSTSSSSSGILGFIKSTVMFFVYLLLGVMGLAALAFVWFALVAKRGDQGFQDFIIEKFFPSAHGEKKVRTSGYDAPIKKAPEMPEALVPDIPAPVAQSSALASMMGQSSASDETDPLMPSSSPSSSFPKFDVPSPVPSVESPSAPEPTVPSWMMSPNATDDSLSVLNAPDPLTDLQPESPIASPTFVDTFAAPMAESHAAPSADLPLWMQGSNADTDTAHDPLSEPAHANPVDTFAEDEQRFASDGFNPSYASDDQTPTYEMPLQSDSPVPAPSQDSSGSTANLEDLPDWLKMGVVTPAEAPVAMEEAPTVPSASADLPQFDLPVETVGEKEFVMDVPHDIPSLPDSDPIAEVPTVPKKPKPKKEVPSAPAAAPVASDDLPDWLK